jgi:protein-L-isoaspartate O-methyltransferase
MRKGTDGYAAQAVKLIERYESIASEEVHAVVLHLLRDAPCRALDIGAGTGRDAAWLAARGHQVVAVEPTQPLREAAMRLHPSERITWLDDGLPDLALAKQHGPFDLIMITAVWMHLDAEARAEAMENVAALMAPGGLLTMLLRHGPIPEGRQMFDVSGAETSELARPHGLDLLINQPRDRIGHPFQPDDVTWTQVAFRKAAA